MSREIHIPQDASAQPGGSFGGAATDRPGRRSRGRSAPRMAGSPGGRFGLAGRASGTFPTIGSEIRYFRGGMQPEVACGTGRAVSKPPKSDRVHTRMTTRRRRDRATRTRTPRAGWGVMDSAPIGALVFASERRNDVKTGVYGDLCTRVPVDTPGRADKLEKAKKIFKSERFDAFFRDDVRYGGMTRGGTVSKGKMGREAERTGGSTFASGRSETVLGAHPGARPSLCGAPGRLFRSSLQGRGEDRTPWESRSFAGCSGNRACDRPLPGRNRAGRLAVQIHGIPDRSPGTGLFPLREIGPPDSAGVRHSPCNARGARLGMTARIRRRGVERGNEETAR